MLTNPAFHAAPCPMCKRPRWLCIQRPCRQVLIPYSREIEAKAVQASIEAGMAAGHCGTETTVDCQTANI